jgi:hypothetical protein
VATQPVRTRHIVTTVRLRYPYTPPLHPRIDSPIHKHTHTHPGRQQLTPNPPLDPQCGQPLPTTNPTTLRNQPHPQWPDSRGRGLTGAAGCGATTRVQLTHTDQRKKHRSTEVIGKEEWLA